MKELDKRYNHKESEPRIYALWEKSGYFNPDKLPSRHKEPFCILIPPPNANDPLHIGHALFVTLEDIMTRYARMRGKKALWLPGMDHAGFETQVVYEKKLQKEGRSRLDMKREQFYKEVWNYTQKNRNTVREQLKTLGASCDWSREVFTLDDKVTKTVYKTFQDMYKEGLIYRGERLVNYCVKHQTAFSELEIEHQEKDDKLYYLKYGPLTVATVRPETIFGDTAVAVNPTDKRYKNYIGKKVEVDLIIETPRGKILAIEIKATDTIDSTHLRSLRSFAEASPGAKLCCVCQAPHRMERNAITILPWQELLTWLTEALAPDHLPR